jgi:hypothetical protein
VVDRLLASPRYGERWGRHWLDVMRYADSTGSDEDHRYPHAWRYRDYVVEAFNNDMPYNQFVREQLAGDILAADPNSGVGYRGIVATGFLALGKKALAQKDLPLKRYDVVDDQIDVTAKAFLGLTVTCARCHDHKFDPIATRDYYQLAAIFASTLSYAGGETGDPIQTPLAPSGEFEAFEKQWKEFNALEKKVADIIDFDKDASSTATCKPRRSRTRCWRLTASTPMGKTWPWWPPTRSSTQISPAGWNTSKTPRVRSWRSGAAPPTRTQSYRRRVSGGVSPQRLPIRSGSELVEGGAQQFPQRG